MSRAFAAIFGLSAALVFSPLTDVCCCCASHFVLLARVLAIRPDYVPFQGLTVKKAGAKLGNVTTKNGRRFNSFTYTNVCLSLFQA